MNITNLARALLGTVRLVGPVLVALAVLLLVVEARDRAGRARLRLAHLGLSDVHPTLSRRLLAGTLVSTLGVAALCVSLSLEQEVREGPNRMVDRLQARAASEQPSWILQRGSSHFMNDSRLPAAVVAGAVADRTGYAHRLWEQLVTVSALGRAPDTGLVLGVPADDPASPFVPALAAGSRCSVVNGACHLGAGQAIADRGVYAVGTRLQIRGMDFEVVANTATPYSLLNRTVVFTSESAFRRTDGSLESPYAIVVGGPGARTHAEELVRGSGGSQGVEIDSAANIKTANAAFWAGNGTPLLLLVIVLSAAFCGVALYTARRALQVRERTSTGTLLALGLRVTQVCRVDLTRATLTTGVATVLAVPVAAIIVKVVDLGILGFHASLSIATVLAAAGLLLFTHLLGTVAMYLRTYRISVVEAISYA